LTGSLPDELFSLPCALLSFARFRNSSSSFRPGSVPASIEMPNLQRVPASLARQLPITGKTTRCEIRK
jgi:hypothetical protein